MLICNAVLTDAAGARPGDVRIENGVITAVGEGLSAGGDTVLDAGGRTLLPAFIDLHCHFRTPGFEYKAVSYTHLDVYKRQPRSRRPCATAKAAAPASQGPVP